MLIRVRVVILGGDYQWTKDGLHGISCTCKHGMQRPASVSFRNLLGISELTQAPSPRHSLRDSLSFHIEGTILPWIEIDQKDVS